MFSGSGSARPSSAAAAVLLASAGLSAASRRPGPDAPLEVLGRPLPGACPIHRVTGHRCPGCGMSRAFVLIWRGRVRDAIRANLASPLVFATLAWLALEPLRSLVGARQAPRPAVRNPT